MLTHGAYAHTHLAMHLYATTNESLVRPSLDQALQAVN